MHEMSDDDLVALESGLISLIAAVGRASKEVEADRSAGRVLHLAFVTVDLALLALHITQGFRSRKCPCPPGTCSQR